MVALFLIHFCNRRTHLRSDYVGGLQLMPRGKKMPDGYDVILENLKFRVGQYADKHGNEGRSFFLGTRQEPRL